MTQFLTIYQNGTVDALFVQCLLLRILPVLFCNTDVQNMHLRIVKDPFFITEGCRLKVFRFLFRQIRCCRDQPNRIQHQFGFECMEILAQKIKWYTSLLFFFPVL